MSTATPPPELANFPIGLNVAGRYEVLEHLGYGGMGIVLKARDTALDGEIVVLKVLFPRFVSDEKVSARFRREVLLTRKLSHPNIVKIFDIGDAGNNTYFISMEYVEGETLSAKIKRAAPKGLPFEEVPRYLYGMAIALEYAHAEGVVHRDVKPGNVLITPQLQVKITDFGVARSVESKEQLTKTDEAIGSPVYMSPEQLNAKNVDHRSDIYSLGIVGFELAVGHPPFQGNDWWVLVTKHLSEPIPEFASRASGIPYWFQELINRAAAKAPEKRFQSCAEFAKFIAKHFDVSEFAAPPSRLSVAAAQVKASQPKARAPRQPLSRPVALALNSVLFAALAAAGFLVVWFFAARGR